MRKLTSYFDDPRVMRKVTGILIIVSIVEWIVAGFVGWVNSVAYVSHLSQLAITISLIPWWQGTRLEVQADEADVPSEVVSKIVKQTTLQSEG